MSKEVKKLGVKDSINHALFVSQSTIELLIEKGIITQEEYEAKYKSMIESYLQAMSIPEPEFKPFDADAYLKGGK